MALMDQSLNSLMGNGEKIDLKTYFGPKIMFFMKIFPQKQPVSASPQLFATIFGLNYLTTEGTSFSGTKILPKFGLFRLYRAWKFKIQTYF